MSENEITPRGKSALEETARRGLTIAEWIREERYAKALHDFHYGGAIDWDDSLEHDVFRSEAKAVLELVDVEIDKRLEPIRTLIDELVELVERKDGATAVPWLQVAEMIEDALTLGERNAQ